MNPSQRVDERDARRISTVVTAAQAVGAELPEPLLEAVASEATIHAWLSETRQALSAITTGAAVAGSVTDLLAAASKGQRPAGFAAALTDAEQRHRALELEARLLVNAHDEAAVRVRQELRPDALIATLRPVFDDILGEVRKLEPTLRGVEADDAEATLAAAPKVQSARARLLALHERLSAVRSAWAALVPGARDSEYAALRHPERAWGEGWRGRHIARPRPWPETRLAYLAWYATTPAEAWLPTADEVAEAEREAYERDRKLMPQAQVRAAFGV